MVDRPPLLSLDRQVCFALYTASRAVIRAYGPLLAPLGLTYPQYLALLALWEEDGVSVKRLGERLSLDSATLTPLLQRLEERQIVERRRDPSDGRVVRIHLTADGQALKARAETLPGDLLCRFDESEISELGSLREQLWELVRRLDRPEP